LGFDSFEGPSKKEKAGRGLDHLVLAFLVPGEGLDKLWAITHNITCRWGVSGLRGQFGFYCRWKLGGIAPPYKRRGQARFALVFSGLPSLI